MTEEAVHGNGLDFHQPHARGTTLAGLRPGLSFPLDAGMTEESRKGWLTAEESGAASDKLPESVKIPQDAGPVQT